MWIWNQFQSVGATEVIRHVSCFSTVFFVSKLNWLHCLYVNPSDLSRLLSWPGEWLSWFIKGSKATQSKVGCIFNIGSTSMELLMCGCDFGTSAISAWLPLPLMNIYTSTWEPLNGDTRDPNWPYAYHQPDVLPPSLPRTAFLHRNLAERQKSTSKLGGVDSC